jgi:hypothetical protein
MTIEDTNDRLLRGMRAFMLGEEDGVPLDVEERDGETDCGYDETHIDRCEEIVDACLVEVAEVNHGEEAAILRSVQRAVEAMNALNADSDGNLIETDHREDLCELLADAARESGLETDDNPTEEWRAW